jgi:hypothetical protein
MPDEGTVLLVEADDAERERLGRALEDAGYEVLACAGPTAPDYTCIGGREGYCPLLERADAVVLDLWLAGDEAGTGTSSEQLLEMYLAGGRSVVTLGSGGWQEPYARGHVIHLQDHPPGWDVVSAVRTAAQANGFVLRRPLD